MAAKRSPGRPEIDDESILIAMEELSDKKQGLSVAELVRGVCVQSDDTMYRRINRKWKKRKGQSEVRTEVRNSNIRSMHHSSALNDLAQVIGGSIMPKSMVRQLAGLNSLHESFANAQVALGQLTSREQQDISNHMANVLGGHVYSREFMRQIEAVSKWQRLTRGLF